MSGGQLLLTKRGKQRIWESLSQPGIQTLPHYELTHGGPLKAHAIEQPHRARGDHRQGEPHL